MPIGLLHRTPTSTRRWGRALAAGLVAGVLSAFVKLGWEQLLPPRTPDRELPPLVLLQHLGLHTDSMTFSFSGQDVNVAALLVHFGFSIAAVLVYGLLAEVFPGVTLGVGAVYGVGVWVVFHLLLLPLLGLTPAASALPVDEDVSEALGHAVWLVAAELVRRGVRRPPTALRAHR